MLRARGLVKRFRALAGAETVDVLDGADLDVRRGDLVVVTGPSGSGKSTLLNVLGLLEDADVGDVWYDGARVTALGRGGKSRARGRHVGFVFQSFLLLPSLTALDNVLLAARYVGGVTPAHRRRALELMDRLGVVHRRAHYPPQLSGGEQQRVAFCRAVLNEPPLLLADEPTGNLDEGNGAAIWRSLEERARNGAAVVVVSHRPAAARGAAVVLELRHGRLVAGAPHRREEGPR